MSICALGPGGTSAWRRLSVRDSVILNHRIRQVILSQLNGGAFRAPHPGCSVLIAQDQTASPSATDYDHVYEFEYVLVVPFTCKVNRASVSVCHSRGRGPSSVASVALVETIRNSVSLAHL